MFREKNRFLYMNNNILFYSDDVGNIRGIVRKNVKNSDDVTRKTLKAEKCVDTDYKINKVIFNNPATIVFWEDGTKTIVKADEKFDPEKGIAIACMKKMFGNKGAFNDELKKWVSNYDDNNVPPHSSVENDLNSYKEACKKACEELALLYNDGYVSADLLPISLWRKGKNIKAEDFEEYFINK